MVLSTRLYMPVVTSGTIETYIKGSDDRLSAQRKEAEGLLHEGYKLYQEAEKNGYVHPDMTIDSLEENLRCFDFTILSHTDSLNSDKLREFADRGLNPISLRSVCTWGSKPADDTLLKAVIDFYEENNAQPGEAKLAAVSDFPHGWSSPAKKAKNIARLRELDPEAKYLVDIDNVIDIRAWLDGDKEKVREGLAAEVKACVEHGFYMKCIISAAAHAHAGENKAYGSDYFASIYDLTTMVLEEMHKQGLDGAVKSSTGLAAQPGLNHLVSKDDGAMHVKALPRWMAIRDFNEKHGTSYTCKESGGVDHPVHAFVSRTLVTKILGEEAADKMMIGGGPDFRNSSLELMAEMGDPRISRARDCGPYQGRFGDLSRLPVYAMGIPRTSAGQQVEPDHSPDLGI